MGIGLSTLHQGRRTATTVALAASVLVVAGCGSSSGGGSAAGGTADLKPYNGPDDANFTTVTTPSKAAGGTFKLGFLTAFAAIPGLKAEQDAACAKAESLGGTCVAKDANVNVQKQVSQFDELLSAGVTAIAVQPLDPSALAPSLAQAAKTKVAVVGADMPPDLTTPAVANLSTNVSQALDYSSWATMSAVAKAKPGAHFTLLGTASPNPLLQYLLDREKYWGKKQGLVYDGRADAEQDSPQAWSTAAAAIGQRYPNTAVVVTYNDPSAVAALNTLRASGSSSITVADANGFSKVARDAIKSGGMIASYAVPWKAYGEAMAITAYNAANGMDVPKILAIKGQVVTKANSETVAPTG